MWSVPHWSYSRTIWAQSCAVSTGEVGPGNCGPFQPDHSVIVSCFPWPLAGPQLIPVLPEREKLLPCVCCPHLSPWQPLPLQMLQRGGLTLCTAQHHQWDPWAGVHWCFPAALSDIHEGISDARHSQITSDHLKAAGSIQLGLIKKKKGIYFSCLLVS